ncbi:MAG: hypothetical protein R2830_04470 [Saprospiraceae bacterium]
MQQVKRDVTNLLKAVQHTLKLIDKFNSTINLIKEKTPDDRLSLDSHQHIKDQLTKDLVELLAQFDLKIKVESQAA